MHDYNYNHYHPERYPMVQTLPLQKRTALDRKSHFDYNRLIVWLIVVSQGPESSR
jgi:hypothetical protein